MHSCVIYESLLIIGAPLNSDISISFVFTHSNGFLLKSGTVKSMICGDFPLQKRKKIFKGVVSFMFYVMRQSTVLHAIHIYKEMVLSTYDTSEISGKFKKPFFYEKIRNVQHIWRSFYIFFMTN